MSIKVQIDLLSDSVYSTLPVIKKVEVRSQKRLVIKRVVSGEERVTDFDFSNLADGSDSFVAPNGYQDTVYRVSAYKTGGTLFHVGGYLSSGDVSLVKAYTSYPAYPYLVGGETETVETVTETPTWLPGVPGYTEKQQAAIDAYNNNWLLQKRVWMGEAASYSDGVPDIVAQVGYYMKAATAFIKNRFQDPAIAPDVVADVITTLAKGASDIDTVAKFAAAIRQYKALWPNGPTQALGWVSISGSTVTQTKLVDAVQLGEGSLPSDFNAYDTSWLVVNQPGSVSLDSAAPVVDTALTATLTDPDGGISSTTWQWQSTSEGGEWTDISDATGSSYTPVSADVGKILRVTATYTDNASADNTATSSETAAVVSS